MLSLIKCVTPDKMWGGGWGGNELAAKSFEGILERSFVLPPFEALVN